MTPMAVERSARLMTRAVWAVWRDRRWRRPAVLALCLVPWVALLAWHTSLSWFLTDDAFISFRYVRNLLEGHGLVFNPGEYVEGYTNFLWVLELAALWGLFGVRPEQAAPWLSVAYTAATLAVVLWWAARAPGLLRRKLVAWMAVGLLCSSATFATWTSGGGLETRQFTFFVVLATACLLLHGQDGRGLAAASLALGAAALTRPEGPLIAACCFGWYTVAVKACGQHWNRRHLACLVAPFAMLVAAHFLFRYAYYGEWLPNTYYAKHVRPWYEAGFRYLWAAILATGLYLLLPLALAALRHSWRSRRDLAYALPLLCVTAHMAYILRIGGDHFEFRPLDFYWPLLAIPAAHGIMGLADSLWRTNTSAPLRREGRVRGTAITLFLPLLFYCSVLQNSFLYLRTLNLADRPAIMVVTGLSLSMVPGTGVLFAISNDLLTGLAPRFIGFSAIHHRDYAEPRIRAWSPYEHVPPETIPPDAVTAIPTVGIPSYYVPALTVVDTLGLTDATVARNPTTVSNQYRGIAHDRRPPPGYLERRNVNFKPQPLTESARLALARAGYAAQVGPDLWMPFDAYDHEWVANRFDRHPLRTADDVEGIRVISDFEGGLDGWQTNGDGIWVQDLIDSASHIPRIHAGSSYQSSRRWLNTWHPDDGSDTTAKARSPLFVADIDDCLGFLMAGSHSDRTGLRLLANDVEINVWHVDPSIVGGWRTTNFHFVTYPLAEVAHANLQLELFDEDVRGYIQLDHVTLIRAEGGQCPEMKPNPLRASGA